jgi:hypothetical protein
LCYLKTKEKALDFETTYLIPYFLRMASTTKLS